jgi:hypothetical protein
MIHKVHYQTEAAMVDNGNKYRKLIGCHGAQITVDVYDVLHAFKVTCPARQHAIKKLLAAGQRGGKTEKQDLEEAIVSINRSIELIPQP